MPKTSWLTRRDSDTEQHMYTIHAILSLFHRTHTIIFSCGRVWDKVCSRALHAGSNIAYRHVSPEKSRIWSTLIFASRVRSRVLYGSHMTSSRALKGPDKLYCKSFLQVPSDEFVQQTYLVRRGRCIADGTRRAVEQAGRLDLRAPIDPLDSWSNLATPRYHQACRARTRTASLSSKP